MFVSDSYEDIAMRARSQVARGDMDAGLESYRRLSDRLAGLKPSLLERRPELRGLHTLSLAQLANIYHIKGDFDKALALYRRLSDTVPERSSTWRQMAALTHIDMGQTETGLDELRAEAVATPGNHDIWLAIGIECEGLGRAEEAEENLQRATKNAATSEAQTESYLALFDFYRGQGRVDDALAAWNQAWKAGGSEPEYVFPIYQMMWENDRLDPAREYLERETNPLRKGLYQGLLEAEAGRIEEAQKRWKKVARTDALKYDDGHEAWAEAMLRVGAAPEEVVATLQKIWQDGTITMRGLVLLAVAEARQGHQDHAAHALAAACNIGLQLRPRREKLPASNWSLFDELLTDDEVKRPMCRFFDGCPRDEEHTS